MDRQRQSDLVEESLLGDVDVVFAEHPFDDRGFGFGEVAVVQGGDNGFDFHAGAATPGARWLHLTLEGWDLAVQPAECGTARHRVSAKPLACHPCVSGRRV